jgi:hypothetical protein
VLALRLDLGLKVYQSSGELKLTCRQMALLLRVPRGMPHGHLVHLYLLHVRDHLDPLYQVRETLNLVRRS